MNNNIDITLWTSFFKKKLLNYNLSVWNENVISLHLFREPNMLKQQKFYLQISTSLIKCFRISFPEDCSISIIKVKEGKQSNELFFPANGKLTLQLKFGLTPNPTIYISGSKDYYEHHLMLKNLDVFQPLPNHNYYCKGWIHDNLYKHHYLYIQFENLEQDFFKEFPLTLQKRVDVKKALKSDLYLWSGFESNLHIETPFSLSCYISYYTIDGCQRFLMHTFDKNSNSTIPNIIIEKILNPSIECINSPTNFYKLENFDFSVLRNAVLIFNHHLGGGAAHFIQSKIKNLITSSQNVCTIEYFPGTNQYKLKLYINKDYHEVYFEHINWFMNRATNFLREIWINELVCYPDTEKLLLTLSYYIKNSTCKTKFYVHDYYCICPSINLLDSNANYCALPEIDVCNHCLKTRDCQETHSILSWRNCWNELLVNFDEIICFSNSSVTYIEKIYPEIPHKNIYMIPHTIVPLAKPKIIDDNIITIGLLGGLYHHKGLSVIKQIVEYLECNKLPMRVVLIGHASELIESPYFTETGLYSTTDIVHYTELYNIDVFFMSSVWPETFSYTTSEIMSMSRPLLSFDLGAQGERVQNYLYGKTIPLDQSIESIIFALKELSTCTSKNEKTP